MSYQKFIVEARIVADPKNTPLSSGTPLCKFNIAFDCGFGPNKKTTFIEVNTWGKQAEFVAQYFKKGDGILIEGRIEQNRWPDKSTGEKRSKHIVAAERVTFPLGKAHVSSQLPDNTGHDTTTDEPAGWSNTPVDPENIPF